MVDATVDSSENLLQTDNARPDPNATLTELKELINKAPSNINQLYRDYVLKFLESEDHPERLAGEDVLSLAKRIVTSLDATFSHQDITVIATLEQISSLNRENSYVGQLYPHVKLDPIMMFNGQFVHNTDDLKINGAGIDFIFRRTYKNQVSFPGPLGFNWDHSYNLWLRAVPSKDTIFRSTGDLREDTYARHPKFGNSGFNYWVPLNGQHNIIVENNSSFTCIASNGLKYVYEQDHAKPFLHRIKIMEDKHGNFLKFDYDSNGNLDAVKINHNLRLVMFTYDDENRIILIQDYVGRKLEYTYDDFGDLIAVTTPSTNYYPNGLTTTYEYSSNQFTGELQHNITKIIDPEGQLYLENEYGINKGNLNYNRVIKQRQGKGEAYLEYEDVISEFELDYDDMERPAHQTNMTERNGHLIHYVYNKFGNLILKEEYVSQGDLPKLVRWRYRYNADGTMVGSISPEGNIVQYYFGRDDFLRRRGITNEEANTDDYLSDKERLAFGNLLSVVKRGIKYDFAKMIDTNNGIGVWSNFFPDIISVRSKLDIIIKYSYEQDYQQILSSSDPRYTQYADPHRLETQKYRDTLTTYEYRGPANNPNLYLSRIISPNTTLPDGTNLTNIVEEFPQYDGNGKLLLHIDSERTNTKFEYFDSSHGVKEGHLKKKILDFGSLNIATEYQINDLGIITRITHPKGVALGAANTSGYFQTLYEINELNQIVKTTNSLPFAYETRVFYDGNSLVKKTEQDVKDENDIEILGGILTKKFRYDEQNNLLEESVGGSDASSFITTHYKYNEFDKLIRTTQPRGNHVVITYDERFLESSVTKGFGSNHASINSMKHNKDGLKNKVIDGRGNATYYFYDPFNRVTKVVDAIGNIVLKEYDKADNLITECFYEKSNSDGKYYLLTRKSINYDERNNLIEDVSYLFEKSIHISNLEQNPNDEFNAAVNQGLVELVKTQYFFDKKRRLIKVLNPKNQAMIYQYDAVDRKKTEEDNMGNYTEFSYDENSNIIRIDRHERILDPQTNILLREEVFSTIHRYDEINRKKETIDSLGNHTVFYYDSRNNMCKIVDQLLNVKRYKYDIYNRKVAEIIEVTETGLGGGSRLQDIEIKFVYDDNHNLLSITDSRNAVTQYDYDSIDRLFRTIYHQDSSFKELEYDANNNIKVSKDNNGLRIISEYDELNRKSRTSLDKDNAIPSYPLDADDFEEYEYDGIGRSLIRRNNFSEIKTKFDSLSRPYEEKIMFTTSYPHPSGNIILKRTFDILSNRIALIYPSGREIDYIYDNLNRIKQIINKTKGTAYPGSAMFPANYEIARYEYGGLRLFKTIYGNQTDYQLFYDGLGRIISTKHTDSGNNSLLEIQQMYDGAGNERFNINIDGTTTGRIFKYDSLYRLTKYRDQIINPVIVANYSPSTTVLLENALDGQLAINNTIGSLAHNQTDYNYKYDPLGNRIEEKQQGQPTINYGPNLLNEYEQVNGQNLEYDFNGNLIDDGTKRYFYNYRNQLIRVEDKTNNNSLLNMIYDTTGHIIVIKESGGTVNLINDGFNVIEEYDGSNLAAQYVYANGIDARCQLVTNSEELWYHVDHINSTRLLSNSNGQVPTGANYNYDPFGSSLTASSQYTHYLFSGKRFLASIDIYDSKYRQYSSSLGRFLQRDPKGFVDGYNLFSYVGNNPLTFIDLYGTERKGPQLLQDNETPEESWINLVGHGSTGSGAVTTYDTAQRARYLETIETRSAEAVRHIQEARTTGNLAEAEKLAQEVSNLRNEVRTVTQQNLSPGGRLMSEVLEQPREFGALVEHYRARDAFDTYEEVARAAGRSRQSMKTLYWFGKVAGPIGVGIGVGTSINYINNATPEERPRVIVEETGSFLGGAGGATLGVAEGTTVAIGIAALLGLASGPPGWLVIGLGILGAGGGGYFGSEAGRTAGRNIYDVSQ